MQLWAPYAMPTCRCRLSLTKTRGFDQDHNISKSWCLVKTSPFLVKSCSIRFKLPAFLWLVTCNPPYGFPMVHEGWVGPTWSGPGRCAQAGLGGQRLGWWDTHSDGVQVGIQNDFKTLSVKVISKLWFKLVQIYVQVVVFQLKSCDPNAWDFGTTG